MFVPSDSWIALPGNISPTEREHDSPVYHSQLAGVPLCDSHLLGLQGWYWAQAVALSQAQRTMADDQWMSDSVGVETYGPYLGLENHQARDQYPPEAPAQSHYDYIQPLFDNGPWSRVPYAESQPLTPPRPSPALPYAAPSGPGPHPDSRAPYPHAYIPPWSQTQALEGACYRINLDDAEKRGPYVPAPPPPRPSCPGQWATASPGDLRFAPSLSPDLAASPPLSPGGTAPPETPGKPTKLRRSSRHSSPSRRRRTRLPTPEAVKRETAQRPGHRGAMDEFLVCSRLAGKSYREIRRLGGFVEAESTLRGRFRALTKRKEERVRRPEWSDVDIELLRKAVRKLGKGKGPAWLKKISWKEVAEYIVDNGGTYRFGNATCRKKWDELAEAEGY